MIVDVECESWWWFRCLRRTVDCHHFAFSVARVHHHHHRSGIWELWKYYNQFVILEENSIEVQWGMISFLSLYFVLSYTESCQMCKYIKATTAWERRDICTVKCMDTGVDKIMETLRRWYTLKYTVFNATFEFFFFVYSTTCSVGNNNTEEGNHVHKNNKTYKEEPDQVQKTNNIDWTSGWHPRIMV
jgi:hypothetical protein